LDIPAGLHDVLVEGNRFWPADKARKIAHVEAGCSGIYFVNNTLRGETPVTDDQAEAAPESVSFRPPEKPWPVGPAALPADGARHLNLPSLPAWNE
jgi:hypothetical protein